MGIEDRGCTCPAKAVKQSTFDLLLSQQCILSSYEREPGDDILVTIMDQVFVILRNARCLAVSIRCDILCVKIMEGEQRFAVRLENSTVGCISKALCALVRCICPWRSLWECWQGYKTYASGCCPSEAIGREGRIMIC